MCARTQFMTDSFLWADRPIMSKTNDRIDSHYSSHLSLSFQQSATPWMKIYMFFLILSFCFPFRFYFSTIFKSKSYFLNFSMAFLYVCFVPLGTQKVCELISNLLKTGGFLDKKQYSFT